MRIAILLLLVILNVSELMAISRDPNGVNVNTNGATTVFITFGGLNRQVPVEAFWCGELVPATPDIGFRCDPVTLFGSLPIRYDQSTLAAGGSVFTDIMSIPPSVSRRAYQAAEQGAASSFFYVRRFISTEGGPDEYVFVTCRMAGGGARVPFALLDVRLGFDTKEALLPVKEGETPPRLKAEILYNGSGRLKGRWEIVLPGEEPPSTEDLLTEATLPADQRGLQRRYTELERFNVFLTPTGKYELQGPDPERLPVKTEGLYMILLRIEASDDKESDSNLALAGAGNGIVHSGAVAGFPIPPLRYYVGSAGPFSSNGLELLSPAENGFVAPGTPIHFTWTEKKAAALHRLELRSTKGDVLLNALLDSGISNYKCPNWISDRVQDGKLKWRVVALDVEGNAFAETSWRTLSLTR